MPISAMSSRAAWPSPADGTCCPPGSPRHHLRRAPRLSQRNRAPGPGGARAGRGLNKARATATYQTWCAAHAGCRISLRTRQLSGLVVEGWAAACTRGRGRGGRASSGWPAARRQPRRRAPRGAPPREWRRWPPVGASLRARAAPWRRPRRGVGARGPRRSGACRGASSAGGGA